MRSGESMLVTSAHEIFMGADATARIGRTAFVGVRMYVRVVSVEAVLEAVANLRAAYDAFAGAEVDTLTHREAVAVLDEFETLTCQLPTQWHRLLARLQAQT